MTVFAVNRWPTNADLIEEVASLGYLRKDWVTLDPTYGKGAFWRRWRPDHLSGHDLDPAKDTTGRSIDATDLPYMDDTFDAVVIDGPYKLNGNPSDTDGMDERYGVDGYTRWQDRMHLLRLMLIEGVRVFNGAGFLLFKCQDQVCSGKVRWQSREFANLGETIGLELVDRFDFISHRGQPKNRRQVHAAHNASQLLVFRKVK